MEQRINFEQSRRIQACRGIAIIAVLIIHNDPHTFTAVLLRPFYGFGVATFLMLSGYLTKVPINDVKGFYEKRLSRVLIPYVIWTVVFTVAHGQIMKLPIHLLSFASPFPFYYFAVYIQFVLLTPLLGKMLHSKRWRWGFLVNPLALIPLYALAWSRIEWPSILPSTYQGILCIMWFNFYYLGLCVRNGRIKISHKGGVCGKYIVLVLLCMLLRIAEAIAWEHYGNIDMAITQLTFAALLHSLAVLMLMLCYITNVSNSSRVTAMGRFLNLVGNDSFGIYLSHILVMSVLNKSLYLFIPQIFPINVLLLLAVELIGIEICKRIFRKYPRFCKWVGLA